MSIITLIMNQRLYLFLWLMMHASIFWIPPCIQVIIQKSVMLSALLILWVIFIMLVREGHLAGPQGSLMIDIAW